MRIIIASEQASSDKSAIDKLVDKVIKMYYEEDYDYMVSQAKNGRKPEGISTIAEEVEFINRNNLGDGMSSKDIKTAAKIIHQKIKDIDAEIFSKYYK